MPRKQPPKYPRNERLRAIREADWGASRAKFAEAIAAKAAELGVDHVGIDGRMVAKWEDGDARIGYKYRPILTALTGKSDDELGIARPHRSVPSARPPEGVIVPPVDRRQFMTAGLTALFGPLAPPPSAGPISVDPQLVDYFRVQLQGHYRADMLLGPHHLLPTLAAQHQLICDLASAADSTLRRDLLSIGAAYAAMLGWLHQDAGQIDLSARWRDVTLDMAHRSHDPQLVGYALANKASLRVDLRDGSAAVDLADAALADATALAPKVQVIARVHAAHGYSVLGDRHSVDAMLDAADPLIRQVDDDLPWGDACRRTPRYLEVQRATCYTRLPDEAGVAREADAIWSEILGAMPLDQRRDQAVFRARHATVAATLKAPDRALALAAESAQVATATGSARARSELLELHERMRPWRRDRYGRELAELLSSIGLEPS